MKQTESHAVKSWWKRRVVCCNSLLLSEGRAFGLLYFCVAPRRKCLSNWTLYSTILFCAGKLLRQEALWILNHGLRSYCVGGCGNWLAVASYQHAQQKAEQLAEREEMVRS